MPLLGSAAMLLSFDVEPAAIAEHDRWHTQEHLRERLSIPGFLRGTRWVATVGGPRYMVVYEVETLESLESEAYLARLDNPTPWTSKMMPHYRGMSRGLCTVLGSFGLGQGGAAALIRLAPGPDDQGDIHRWLVEEALPETSQMPGLGASHLLKGAQAASMTNEQRLRGGDRGVDSAVILTGYDERAVIECAEKLAANETLRLAEPRVAGYRCAYSLSRQELSKPG